MKKGFTVVEVSLVVAIGGLILLTALLAVPSLMRNARDSQRKTDMESLVSAIKKYQTNNNRGALPSATSAEWYSFLQEFLVGGFSDPNGFNYETMPYECLSTARPDDVCNVVHNKIQVGDSVNFNSGLTFPDDYKMLVVYGAKCGDNSRPVKSSNERKFAVVYMLESNDLFCLDD